MSKANLKMVGLVALGVLFARAAINRIEPIRDIVDG